MTEAAGRTETRLRDDGTVRVLGRDDLPAAVRILSQRPVENVFVASRVRAAGLDPASLGAVPLYRGAGRLRTPEDKPSLVRTKNKGAAAAMTGSGKARLCSINSSSRR